MRDLHSPIRVILSVGLALIFGCSREAESRGPFTRCVWQALKTYAADNGGMLPTSSKSGLDALQKLYPNYTASGVELAGLSADCETVVNTLKAGEPLTDKLSSWVYSPGLRATDDPRIAVLWEAKFGVFPDGSRDPSGRRTVLLLGGDITNVAPSDWRQFILDQESLRKSLNQNDKRP